MILPTDDPALPLYPSDAGARDQRVEQIWRGESAAPRVIFDEF